MRKISKSAVAVALAAFLIGATPVSAGTGIAADPWKTLNIWYSWTNQSGPSSTSQVMKATQAHLSYVEFWAYAPVLHSAWSGDTTVYIGLQTQGTLKGSLDGVVVAKSIHFSIFGKVGQPVQNLQPTSCSAGADGGAGLSCAKSFGWVVGAAYTPKVDLIDGITTPGWCPAGISPCTVAVGSLGSTQIGAFSYSPLAYGTMAGSASSFLEIPLGTGGTCNPTVPKGQFTIPSKVVSGSTLYVSNAWSWDRTDTMYPQTCARTWNDWLTTWISY